MSDFHKSCAIVRDSDNFSLAWTPDVGRLRERPSAITNPNAPALNGRTNFAGRSLAHTMSDAGRQVKDTRTPATIRRQRRDVTKWLRARGVPKQDAEQHAAEIADLNLTQEKIADLVTRIASTRKPLNTKRFKLKNDPKPPKPLSKAQVSARYGNALSLLASMEIRGDEARKIAWKCVKYRVSELPDQIHDIVAYWRCKQEHRRQGNLHAENPLGRETVSALASTH